jgi:hypothetical protein
MVGVVGDARNVYQLLSLLREEEEESSELLLSSAFLESERIAKGAFYFLSQSLPKGLEPVFRQGLEESIYGPRWYRKRQPLGLVESILLFTMESPVEGSQSTRLRSRGRLSPFS